MNFYITPSESNVYYTESLSQQAEVLTPSLKHSFLHGFVVRLKIVMSTHLCHSRPKDEKIVLSYIYSLWKKVLLLAFNHFYRKCLQWRKTTKRRGLIMFSCHYRAVSKPDTNVLLTTKIFEMKDYLGCS